MSRVFHRPASWVVAIMLVFGLVGDVAARGGGGGGGGRGGGGGFSRGGQAAGGSFGQNRGNRGRYNGRGPAADGNFEMQALRQREWEANRQARLEEMQQRRDAWQQEDRQERREDFREFVDDRDGDYDDDGYYYGEYYDTGGVDEPQYYWTLPCRPTVMAMGGTTYFVCGSDWYVRAYVEGDVAYIIAPNPTGHYLE